MGAKANSNSSSLKVGDLALNPEERVLHKGSRRERLTPKETRLLEAFMSNYLSNGGRVLTRKYLMKEVWDTDYLGDTRTLDVHIRWLRQKIEDDPSRPRYLRTVRGVGYQFSAPDY